MEPIANPAPAPEAATAPAVSQGQGSTGTAAPVGGTTPSTPAPVTYKPDEVERWKQEAEIAQGFRFVMEQNPDLEEMVLSRVAGRSKYQPRVGTDASQVMQPAQKVDPILEKVSSLESMVQQQEMKRRREENEKEISDTLKQHPFVDRSALERAYSKESLDRYNKMVYEGVPAPLAAQKAKGEMASLPLEYLVQKHFKTEYQDYLVKQKTSGALPPGVNSRGDRVNNGQSSFRPGFLDGKIKAFHEARNIDRQLDIAVETAREMGLNPDDYGDLQKVESALRLKDPSLINGG